jgi:hypothetical protein
MRKLSRLSYPRLDAPPWTLVSIFRAFDAVLRRDARFSTVCNTFLSWTGSGDDTRDPAYALCPYCRISPFPTSSDWVTEKQHNMPLTIQIEVAVQGTDFDQLGNFWGLIQAALFPQDNPAQRDVVITTLQAAGVTRPTVKLSAFGTDGDNESNYILIGRGSIQFGALVMT